MKIAHLLFAASISAYALLHWSKLGLGEFLALSVFVCTFLVARYAFKKDVSGMLLAGLVPGFTLEWITEAYWNYHLNVYLVKDVSLFVVLGWGYNFAFLVLISNAIYRKLTGRKEVVPGDRRILLIDGLIGPVFFIANELIGVNLMGLWEYTPAAGWNTMIPGLHYPLEAVIGAEMISLLIPTYIRHWESRFRVSAA